MAELRMPAFSLTWGYFNDRERVKENFLPLSHSDHFQHQAEPIESPYGTFWRVVSQLAVGLKQSFKLTLAHTRSHLRMCTLLVHLRHTRRKKNNIPLNVWQRRPCLPHASTRAKPHKGEEKKMTLTSYRYWVTTYFHLRRTLEVLWLAAVRWRSHSGCELVQILCSHCRVTLDSF